MPATVDTREREVSRFVELEALSTLIARLAESFRIWGHSRDNDTARVKDVCWDTLMVYDLAPGEGGGSGDSSLELSERLWETRAPDEYFGERPSIEELTAQAETFALTARMFVLLGTEEARAMFAEAATGYLRRAEATLTEIRLLGREGG